MAQASTDLDRMTRVRALLNAANEKGNWYAKYRLGKIYLDGNIVEKNEDSAKVWFSKAAEEGPKTSKPALLRLSALDYAINPDKTYQLIEGPDRNHHWGHEFKTRNNVAKKCWQCGDIYHGEEFDICHNCLIELKIYK